MASYRGSARTLYRIQILFTLAVVIPVNVAGWFAYASFSRELDAALTGRLFAIAAEAAEAVSQQVTFAGPEAGHPFMNEILGGLLEDRLIQSDLTRVYLTSPRGEPRLLLSYAAEVGDSTVFIETDRQAVDRARQGEYVAVRGQSLGQRAIRAYVPVWGGFNEIAGVLGVEDAPDYANSLALFQRGLILFGGVSVALAAVLLVLSGRLVRRALSVEAQIERTSRAIALGRMSASVAHEIRNPVGIISTNAQVLARHADGPVREIAGDILEETGRLGLIVQRFLDLSEPRTHFRPVRLEPLLAQAIHSVQRATGPRPVEWVEDIPPEESVISGDPDRLLSVLVNVLENAVQAIPDRGRVEVRTRRDGESVVVTIRDDGAGMDRPTLEAAKEPFFTRKAQGTGLGLTLADRILHEHGGSLEMESAPGEGTTVRLRLPLVADASGKE